MTDALSALAQLTQCSIYQVHQSSLSSQFSFLRRLRAKPPDRAFRIHTRCEDLSVGCPAGIKKIPCKIRGDVACGTGFWIKDTELPIPGRFVERCRDEDFSVLIY